MLQIVDFENYEWAVMCVSTKALDVFVPHFCFYFTV